MKRSHLISILSFSLIAAAGSRAEITPSIPDNIDPDRHYLFYLHGQVVEGSEGGPIHPDHGEYKYHSILEHLDKEGFWVISEIRRKNSNPDTYAGLIAFYVNQLKKAGVPSSNITILGGSKGGIIACYASHKLKDEDINLIVMAGFFDRLKKDPQMEVWGRVLAIHDDADRNGIDPKYFLRKSPGVSEDKVVVTDNGWGHGLIFEPRSAWIREVVKWSGISSKD